jgi:protein-disulfide isomerase
MFRISGVFFAAVLIVSAQTGPQAGKPGRASTAETAAPSKTAFDRATFEAYVRHLFVWPAQVQVTVSDPEPGPMAGFSAVKVRGSMGPQSQEETFYISKDGQHILRGNVYDVNQNPFKPELEKLKTELQPSMGTPGAPVVLVEFSDFECPYCREEAKSLRANLLAAYPSQVRLYFLDYPLDSLHPWAHAAARIGRCIFRQNASGFWAWHDWIFEHQKEITADNLKAKALEFAKTLQDVDTAQLTKCINSNESEADVQKSIAEANSLNVNQTPTLFVNGRRIPGAVDWNVLKSVIDFEIGYQKTAKNAGEDCGCSLALPTAGAAASTPSALTSPHK